MTAPFMSVIGKYLNDEQAAEFEFIQEGSVELKDDVVDRSFQVVKTNRDTVLAQGHHVWMLTEL